MTPYESKVTVWREILRRADCFSTPFYALWSNPFLEALRLARSTTGFAATRHWYSYKSQPVPALARVAISHGMGLEVVSPFELFAAQQLGLGPQNILVNGLSKHHWLPHDFEYLNVVFDSLNEIQALASRARELRWRCGLRVAVSQQINVEALELPVQFGLDLTEVRRACVLLRDVDIEPDILHFHLHSNVDSISKYQSALEELREIAFLEQLNPRVIDIGGGLPDVTLMQERTGNVAFSIERLGDAVAAVRASFPSTEEVWLENGRALLGPAGVLVVSVLDIKKRGNRQLLICDGGRTNQALPSEWESHHVALIRNVDDVPVTDTLMCGPTCMAQDWFFRGSFPSNVRIGDRIVYFNAGAYHIPWETRFSFGACRVLWVDDRNNIREIRKAEQADEALARWHPV
jgi:diaminopimelate decarboxylase